MLDGGLDERISRNELRGSASSSLRDRMDLPLVALLVVGGTAL
jgi:hypothetical protein